MQKTLQRLTLWHFLYAFTFSLQIVIFDAWQLISPVAILTRWISVLFLLATTVVIWYLAHGNRTAAYLRNLVFGLILTDIVFAALAVHNQRGMASRAVALFFIPIIVSAVLRSRAATIATAVLCCGAYIAAAVSYFVLNFNEGYKIELYGEIGFYCAMFLVAGSVLAVFSGGSSSAK